jgi:formylglycine-generating enzyme required for sulfatase activity
MRDGRTSAFVIPPGILRKACEEIRFGGDSDGRSGAVSEDAPKTGGTVSNQTDPGENAGVRVFISYAKEDVEHAKRLYRDLKKAGFSPWLDAEELLPGQNWVNEIVQAVRESRYFVALLSERGLSRNGFVHRELKKALEVMEEYPERRIFLIPARLDDCQPQDEQLRGLHWADLFPDYGAGFEKVRRALEFQRALDETERRRNEEESRVEVLDPVDDSKKEPKAETSQPPPKFTNSLGMEFIWIPPGEFWMGQTEEEKKLLIEEAGEDTYKRFFARELPRHRVTLTQGFYLQTTPVTVAQWIAFHEATGYRTEAERGDGAFGWTGSEWKKQKGVVWKTPGFSQADDHPVTCVSCNDAAEFLEWMGKREGEGYRLPTEAEWEYACRAGTETAFYSGPITEPEGRDPNLEKVGWYRENSGGTTHPVRQKEPNAWGLYDMHGNVREWCSDRYGKYPDGPAADPTGADTGAGRVGRGGAWRDRARRCRAAYRIYVTPGVRDDGLGFRLLAERQVRRFKSSTG